VKLRNLTISTTKFLLLTLLAIGQTTAGQQQTAASPSYKPGAVVEKVTANYAAEKAGLLEGDVLLSWVRGDAKGQIESPFDVSQIEIEQGPRGAVTLEGLCGPEKRTWTFTPGDWGLKTRPNLPPDLLSLYQEGQEQAKAGNLTQAAEHWHTAAGKIDGAAPAWLRLWLLSHAADILAEGRQWKDADAAYQEVIAQCTGAGQELKAQLLRGWADTFRQRADWVNADKYYQQAAEESQKLSATSLTFADTLDRTGYSVTSRGDLTTAEKYFLQAIEIQQKLAPASLPLAKSFNGLGNVAKARGDLAKAEDFFRQAFVIREKLAPGSLDLAGSLINLGNVAQSRGEIDKAEQFYLQSLAIREKLSPESLDVSANLDNLGLVAWNRGNLAKAEEYHSKALAIEEKLAPGSLEVARSLSNLAIVASVRRDLVKAEECNLQALAIREKLAPDSLLVASSLNNLAIVAENRGELAKAEKYSQRALAIKQKQAPNSLTLSSTFNSLGNIAYRSGDLAKSEDYHRQSLAIKEKLAPGSLDFAVSLSDLGVVVRARGDVKKAEEYYRQSLEIRQKLAPGSLDVADGLNNLADLLRDRGDLTQAEDDYRQVRAIEAKLAPESKEYAAVLADLAGIMLRKGELDAAAPLFEQALNALEGQTAHLGGSEDVRSNFRAKYLSYYQDYIDLLIRQKRPEMAFQVLERSRARTLLEMLAETHIDVHKGVDAALLERARSLQGDISAKYDRRIRLLGYKHTDQQIAAISQEIEKLLAAQKDLEEQILVSSPSYAALTQPQPLSATQAQQLLDDDTLLLAYSLGQERSYLFALTRDSLDAYPLPKRSQIETAARLAYKELSINNPVASHKSTTALSRMLLDAAAERLGKKRLVIVADGALQYVPFGALRTPQGGLLIAGHEIVNLPSASTLAVLRKETETRAPAPKQVAVLADPVFDSNDERLKPGTPNDPQKKDSSQNESNAAAAADDSATDLLTRSATDMGLMTKGVIYLPRLLSTRQEAKSILAAAPPGQGLAALDFDASRATAISPTLAQYRIVHFATHGLLNSTHPELSGLVLSLVNQQGKPQNGFLDLQDIYNLNLPADLVVLSACETGLGQQIQGEGLVGMTRAFMYAGAPRVVASLWRVPDRATSELMKQFYAAMLGEGLRPAAALRKAQVTLSKEKRWSAPYYWAGFTLQGEWK
jgi:CHAT domain-containing protein/tetratricopeptide (TPR) repeat protein